MSTVLTCVSISEGWSPTGTLVIPGKSTNVRLITCGEKIFKLIGSGQIPCNTLKQATLLSLK